MREASHSASGPPGENATAWTTLARRGLHLLGRRAVLAVVVGVAGSMGLGVVELAIALFLQLFLQRIGVVTQPMALPGPLRHYTLSTRGLVGGLFAIAVARACGQYLTSRGGFIALETTNAHLRRLAVYEMLLAPSRQFVPAAVVNARVGEIFPKAAWCGFFGAPLIASVAQGVVLVAVMGAAAWRESLIALAGLGLVGLVVLAINRRTRVVAARMPREQYLLTEGIERVARNVFLVRALRTEPEEHRRFVRSIEAYEAHSIRTHVLSAAASNLTPFLALLLLLGIILVSQRILHTRGLALLSFLYLFIRFAQNLAASVQMFSQVNQFFPQLHEALSYVSRFSEQEVDTALKGPPAAPRGAGALRASSNEVDATDPLGPTLRIAEVGYAYPGSVRAALSHVSATVPAGSQFAVVGPSGAGKSTLLALLLGLMRPSSGRIEIDGRPPEEYFGDPGVRVGYVGADPFLIAGTVRDNICYGVGRAVNDAEIDLALDRARVRKVVDELPGRLDYPIAEDGSGLSAGQKQRLCLARAVLNRPHVLVLDEVSANLDAATEAEITESLRELRGRCTTIIVSHRSAILKYADQVLELPVRRGSTGPDAREDEPTG
jgi:ABC-type multidrug transport system fused ATPase/permease subunit